MKDMPEAAWMAVATIAIWAGIGVAASYSPEQAANIVGGGAVVTTLIWLGGKFLDFLTTISKV